MAVVDLVHEFGMTEAAELLTLAAATIGRLAAGLDVRETTLSHVRAKLRGVPPSETAGAALGRQLVPSTPPPPRVAKAPAVAAPSPAPAPPPAAVKVPPPPPPAARPARSQGRFTATIGEVARRGRLV